MAKPKNILFIMFDQLRWDYLSCYGHPHLKTPNIDRIAARGVRFDNARIQSPLCGPSRMSTFTGRYVHSHGASWNNVPLKVGERTMGDHLRDRGMGCWLVGKTHMAADAEGMRRLGLAPDSVIGARVAECGFDIWERDDGMRPEGPDGFYDPGGALKYNDYLRDKGYDSDNPWHDYANSGIDDDGNVLSGWFLENSDSPANIREEDSETPYLTRRGIAFIEAQGDQPWCCHLSYIKPHWPYIVPDPYAGMYGPEHFLPPVRSDAESETDHPVFKGFQNAPVGKAFARDDIRDKVLTAYMGLIKQCDDQMGVLFNWLEKTGRMEDTMIVITSDHGDFLGDHWLGEKTFFHDASVKVPMIIYDPSEEADATRGTSTDALVECIDLAPTFVDVAGGDASALDHILEGHSLLPLLRGGAAPARDFSICEYDYSSTPLAGRLDLHPDQSRMFMVADHRWKMIHFESDHRPMLFDLQADPDELTDLGNDADHAETIARMYDKLNTWARRPSARTTLSNATFVRYRTAGRRTGVLIGVTDASQATNDAAAKYIGRKVPDKRGR
ncbi:sulfatase-like hydrolase/transferase [Pseudosulfitobacter pseudonitzschiae]|uniref:sulfatase-like hydrolase/transferase n=1 Tax=Pseudosulfitobacter pseudonitzschiae TaxID=1402135 RepID=UPI001AF0CD45|nr:sulfatase-like hydrolase/transferase [Pseudosulfitobacter pseudonitzschiae]MBM1817319.1 sulfatase-like hydrolase/transferase [Pseudosulfitobacter pseudonitzschiae]MBM1834330.1 sulfatase-like hydrolase/transferase [Pseudosulfitobacter pseudonitzschiae]MBM1839195.1 sulfatase-like hydrolase/transferase [Pseudosulfitobacter pseudonitzschiae]MBM1844044.1 sulfatase-like hydrolase/transferase [Pseudosulfitobacter pseudonitzschiae]MBM1848880.1 sulfatase-like hydrolase/transferase [Pseudosulfitobact